MSQSRHIRPLIHDPLRLEALRIRTKDRRIVPFRVNEVQSAYLDTLEPSWREQIRLSGVRELLLKARQFGFSTLILGLYFLDTITTPNTQTVVIAHDAASSERLFKMVHRFYNHLPERERPRTMYSNRREMEWPELDSLFFVGTAGAGEFGRGGTINNVHGSEVAFWPEASDLVAGVMEAVPAGGNVFLETTANGMNNWFYDEYQLALVGDSAFTPRFHGWNEHREYRIDFDGLDDESLEKLLKKGDLVRDGGRVRFVRTAEEKSLAERHGLDDAQLLWRRLKKRGLRDKFVQEYPITAHEAFISSGGRVLSEFIPERAPKGHLVPDFRPPRNWRFYLVIDPGWNKAGHLWAAVDPNGDVWLFAEHYEGHKRPAEHMAVLHAMWQIFGRPEVDTLMDPSAFDIQRNRNGQETPSDAAEYRAAADELGAEWFLPRKADNGDPHAYRVKRYLAEDRVRVCEGLKFWRWEADKWVRQAPLSGRAAAERRDPDRPIDKNNHLMDPTRYLFNELPDPLPREQAVRDPVEEYWERVRQRQREGERIAKLRDWV